MFLISRADPNKYNVINILVKGRQPNNRKPLVAYSKHYVKNKRSVPFRKSRTVGVTNSVYVSFKKCDNTLVSKVTTGVYARTHHL